MNKKYLIISNEQYPADTLIRLYQVDPNECIRDNEINTISPNEKSRLIRLFPRKDRDYTISSASSRA